MISINLRLVFLPVLFTA